MVSKLSERDLELFTASYNEQKYGSGASKSSNSPLKRIPTFYQRPPSVENDLANKLKEEARSRFLQRKSAQLLDNDELQKIWTLLDDNHTPPVVDDEKMIGYVKFLEVKTKLPEKAIEFFTPIVFGKLQQRDPYGRVSILTLFNYVMRKTWLRQSRIGLSLYDITGQGFLTEKDLELYISELIPTLPQLERLEESFHSFYICTAVRRFLFFLDPKRLGKVRIVDILASGFLDDLLELRDAPNDSRDESQENTPRSTESAQIAALEKNEKNWFSAANALRVYGQYLNLDADRNGMLSRAELKDYGGGTLTETFIDRVFQECLTYEGEMDYKSYLDFVLAMENKKDRSSLEYFIRILDIRQKGYLDGFALNYFFRDIQKLLEADDQPMVEFHDIKDELFDMIKPKDSTKILLQDLIDSKQGDTFVSILIDLDGFWKYENREYLATEQDSNDEAEC